ncbi:hypothetical protein BaRGS_00017389 [Batillaria attramentaria]|uniref:Uncharacterized protein n=1 Tax=Batillaria attramentaria TaxID=370345 RepID=A0ABD0KVS5_9CAEN
MTEAQLGRIADVTCRCYVDSLSQAKILHLYSPSHPLPAESYLLKSTFGKRVFGYKAVWIFSLDKCDVTGSRASWGRHLDFIKWKIFGAASHD